jgi:NAD(P)-dependent dehydrogenase (short-subunit alcohol dehydrogenase family)
MTSLDGKTALVTGGSRGIGAAIVVELARAGADVVINYFRSEAKAREVAAEVERQGRRALLARANVADKAEIDRMFDQVEDAWGKLDILVNNAGIEERWPTRDCRESNYDAIMNTNVKGAFFCAQRALEGMKEKGWGRVINISSVHEVKATNFCSVYGISKGALQLLVRELALEYSRYGITVNNVAPGAIRTDINRQVLSDPAYEAKVISRIPVGFIGEPEDVAHLVVFVASEEARYITGATLLIDGGLSL